MTVTEMLKGMSMVHLYLKFFCFFGARLKSSKRELGGRGKRQSRSTRKHLKSPTGPLGGREPLESAYATTGPTSVGVEGQAASAAVHLPPTRQPADKRQREHGQQALRHKRALKTALI